MGRWWTLGVGELGAVCSLVRAEAVRNHQTSAPVKVIWGDARWSRAQLLGELRAAIGACARPRSTTCLRRRRAAQWQHLVASENERIVYAPSSEMTEDMEEEEGGRGRSDEEEAEGGSGRGGIGDDDDDDDEEEEEDDDEDEDEPGGTLTHRVKGQQERRWFDRYGIELKVIPHHVIP